VCVASVKRVLYLCEAIFSRRGLHRTLPRGNLRHSSEVCMHYRASSFSCGQTCSFAEGYEDNAVK